MPPIKLQIYNPSQYPRAGTLTVPWELICRKAGVPPGEVVVHDEYGNALPTQVDYAAQPCSARATLVFSLAREVSPGPEDYSAPSSYVTVERGRPAEPGPHPEVVKVGEPPHELRLMNEEMQIHFNLNPSPWGDGRDWYAGSATSVQIGRQEILDTFRSILNWLDHDPEKRCMQVDQIKMPRPPWDGAAWQQVSLFDRPYSFVASSVGQIRAAVVIASEPFDYTYFDPVINQSRRLKCSLHREISLCRGADFVAEELRLRGVYDGAGAEGVSHDLLFAPRYFTYMDLGLYPSLFKPDGNSGWFAMSGAWAPHQSYGFATDAHVSSVSAPHEGFPVEKDAHKTFSWELQPVRSARCLHLFAYQKESAFLPHVGRVWYEHIYKPLKAEIAP